jgi:DNA-binding NtrC family response regulator
MSPSAQAKILRVLEEKEFERVGGQMTIRVDVRVISATNRDLKEEVSKKRFREDLYYRLNVVTIDLPPLRERRDDIIPLSIHFLHRFSGELGKRIKGFSSDAEKKLKEYRWPGNIRELRNTIERAVLLCERDMIQGSDIFLPFNEMPDNLNDLEKHERNLILQALEKANWVQKIAASSLGISGRALNYRIKKFGIRNPSWWKNR